MTARKQPDVWVEIRARAYPSGVTTTTRRSTKAMAYPTKIVGRIRAGSYSEIERALSDWKGTVEAAVFSWEEEDSDGAGRSLTADLGATKYAHPEVDVKLLSEVGRKAGLTPRIVQRGYLTRAPQPAPNRKTSFESVDAIGSRFYRFDPEGPIQSQFITTEHLEPAGLFRIPAAVLGKPYNIIIGEHSDRGAVTSCGTIAVKGFIPVDYIGRCVFPLGSVTGIDSHAGDPIPPPTISASIVGAGGSSTYYYAVTMILADGSETAMSNIVTVTGAPALSELSLTNYVHLEIAPPAGWETFYADNAVHFRLLGRSHNPPTTYLDAADQGVDHAAGYAWYDDGAFRSTRDEFDVEKPWRGSACGTALIVGDDLPWGVCVVALGAVEILVLYGSDEAEEEAPARVVLDPDDPDVISPLSGAWPHATPYVDVNGVRLTLFYARGTKLQHHIDGVVTFAASVCGVEDVGDGTGTPITEAANGLQWLINEIVLNHYSTGAYGTLATYSDGVPITKTSSFTDLQADTVGFIGGRGYQMHLAITEKVTLSEVLQWWCRTFTAYIGVTQHGQITVHVIDITANPVAARHFRQKIEIDGPLPEAEIAEDEVENRIFFRFDYDPDAGDYRTGRIKIEDLPSQAMYGMVDADDDALDLRCTRDETTARHSMGRRLRLHKVAPVYQPIPTGMIGYEQNLGDVIRVTHPDGVGAGGYQEAAFFIVRQGLQLNGPQHRVNLVARYIGNSLVTAIASNPAGGGGGATLNAVGFTETIAGPVAVFLVVNDTSPDIRVVDNGYVVATDMTTGFVLPSGRDGTAFTLSEGVAVVQFENVDAEVSDPPRVGLTEAVSLLTFENGAVVTTSTDSLGSRLTEAAQLTAFENGSVATVGTDTLSLRASEVGYSPAGFEAYVLKALTETVTSNTTPQDDDELTYAVGANEKWLMEFQLLARAANTTPDIKVQVTVPSGATGYVSILGGPAPGSTLNVTCEHKALSTLGPFAIGLLSSSFYWITVRAYVSTSVTAGSVTLQWAQNTSSGTGTQVDGANSATTPGFTSYLHATKLA